jgi:lipoprotein-anchoring transpeptidase ErfK/SrfK
VNKKTLGIIIAILIAIAVLGVFILSRIKRPSCGDVTAAVSLPEMLAQLKELSAKADLFGLKTVYQKLIDNFPGSGEVALWQKKVEEINISLLFSPIITSGSILYEIKPGDTLNKIAGNFKTTVELIKISNGIASDKITPGRKIKVWNAPFSIAVDKSQNILFLKSGEEIFKSYLVSTGKDNSTPVGNFKITNKLLNPAWFRAGSVVPAGSPENILGTRWMGFELAGYGIHGTVDPQSLGKQVTQGCVRMANNEVEELYSIVPEGTEVAIVD